jgi:hypothetical protein
MDTSRHLPTRLGLTSNSRRGAAAARVVRHGRGIRKVYARLASIPTTSHAVHGVDDIVCTVLTLPRLNLGIEWMLSGGI